MLEAGHATCTLPMEYAVEWSRLISLQMEGSVG
jgi:Fe-S cluster assembly scaffold protein SufB